MPDALSEQYAVGGFLLFGKEEFRRLLDENFGGEVPKSRPWSVAWFQFSLAVSMSPFEQWRTEWGHRPNDGKRLPAFPAELAATPFQPYFAHKIPQTNEEKARGDAPVWSSGFPPTNIEPFWIGFWSAPETRNPYSHPDNANAFENGRTLSKAPHAETYRKYVAACRQVCREEWGEGARIP